MHPTRLGPYAITRRLGRGGMGAVYEAEDTATGAAVAVKTLAANLVDDDSLRKRFQAEIETLKTLRHPGIVRLLAFGEEEGEPYFVMELVRGQSLEQLLRAGKRFSWQETVAVAADIARALKAAHDHGVVHRDLKPANLLLVDRVDVDTTEPVDPTSAAGGSGLHVKLADFGIARLFGVTRHTMAGTVVGTAEYMAPEQATGGPVDQRADLYALGLVMFAMLTGKPPFHGDMPDQLLERHRHEPPPRVSALVSDIPPALDELIDRLLAKDPALRPASGLALVRLLAAVAAPVDPTAAPAATPLPAPASLPKAAQPKQVDLFTATWEMPAHAAPTERPVVIPDASRGRPIDAAAATAAFPGPDTAAGSGRRDRPARDDFTVPMTTVPTEADRGFGQPGSSRHTTVAELDRAARGLARRRLLWQMAWRTIAFVGLMGMVAAGSWVLLRRPEPAELHARVLATVAANPDRIDGLKDAEPDILRFLDSYPHDDLAAAVRGLKREIDVDRLETRARLRDRKPVAPFLRIERDYRMALALKSSDPAGCVAALEEILATPRDALAVPLAAGAEPDELARDPDLWIALVRRQIQSLATLGDNSER
jgi:serine/threonine protein kinase